MLLVANVSLAIIMQLHVRIRMCNSVMLHYNIPLPFPKHTGVCTCASFTQVGEPTVMVCSKCFDLGVCSIEAGDESRCYLGA